MIGLAGIFILVEQGNSSDGQPGTSLFEIAIILMATLAWSAGSIYSHSAELPKSALLGSGMELLAGSAGSSW